MAAGVTAGALGVLAPSANAADTSTTFTINGGALSISVPSSSNLTPSGVSAGSPTASGALGSTSVTDGRGNLVAAWTVSVSSTNFTTGLASADETVSKNNVSYTSGVAAPTTGTGVFTPGVIASLATAGTGGVWAGVGVNSATWNPTIGVVLLNGNNTAAVTGTYSGTLSQSVS
jgi:hypothetical protein